MARTIQIDDHQRVIVQGFRAGGGVAQPYVFMGRLDSNDNMIAMSTMGIRSANELGECLRQEAEFANSEREESSK